MYRDFFKKLTLLLGFVVAFGVLSLTSCDEEDLLECNRCPDDAPWSPANGGACYESRSDCEAQENDECIICTN